MHNKGLYNKRYFMDISIAKQLCGGIQNVHHTIALLEVSFEI
jgi:hypothetical protein